MGKDANFLTADDLVARWKGTVTKQTLANWRVRKPTPRGPGFVKIGGRVLYPLEQVVAWELENLRDPKKKRLSIRQSESTGIAKT